jgi:hypothetical protein
MSEQSKEYENELTSRHMPSASLNKRQKPGSDNPKERRRIREFRGESNLKDDRIYFPQRDMSDSPQIINNEQESHLAFKSFASGRAGSNECISTIH